MPRPLPPSNSTFRKICVENVYKVVCDYTDNGPPCSYNELRKKFSPYSQVNKVCSVPYHEVNKHFRGGRVGDI